jgi:hypothetical protein
MQVNRCRDLGKLSLLLQPWMFCSEAVGGLCLCTTNAHYLEQYCSANNPGLQKRVAVQKNCVAEPSPFDIQLILIQHFSGCPAPHYHLGVT